MTAHNNDMAGDGHTDFPADGVVVPFDRLPPDTLLSVISEFVTREWEEGGTVSYTLEMKVEQVMRQLRNGQAQLVFDPLSGSCNIISAL